METPRRSFASLAAAAGMPPSSHVATTRFPGIGGGGGSHASSHSNEYGGTLLAPRDGHGMARTDDEIHLEHWKETLRAQDEDQALLHQTVVASKRQQLDMQHERLAKQRAFIRHEKRKILLQNALLESEKERFEASLTSDWFCLAAFPTVHDRRITLDVGGQLFEISTQMLLKDANSMLAALVADDSPLSTLDCGCFRVDRDWWLFRYVLHFLRDGMLPQDPKLLRELYLESEFWKLDSLRKAIEMKNMELLQIKQENDAKTAAAAAARLAASGASHASAKYHLDSALLTKMKTTSLVHDPKSRDPQAWWLEAPTWWGSGASGAEKKEPKLASLAATAMKRAQLDELEKDGKAGSKEMDAWWKSTSYKGKDFTMDKRLSGDGDHRESTPRSPLMVSSTWQSTTTTK